MRRSLIVLVATFVTLSAGVAVAQNASQTNSDRKIVNRSAPVYPELAKRMHIHGVVKIEAIVRPNGTVKSTRVLGGNPVLVDAAQQAVSKWKFETSQAEGTQVVQVSFEDQ